MFTFAQFVATVTTESIDNAVMYAEAMGISKVNVEDWKRKVAAIVA